MTDTPAILQVATTDIDAMMNPGPARRMPLPGFDDEFVDLPHYIIRITEKIWHDRQVEKCLDWYSADCRIHTLAGPVVGAQAVVANTHATLAAFPDRRLDGDNVIWSDEGSGAFLSSHLITSKMTNLGASEFGPATGRRVLVRTIADCLCVANRIVEEWLVRDNLALVNQLGLDAVAFARAQAAADRDQGRDLTAILHPYLPESQSAAEPQPATDAARIAVALLRARWLTPESGTARALSDFRLGAWLPGGVFAYGPDQVAAFIASVRGTISDLRLRIDHIAEIPYLGDARDVAVRWSLSGTHAADGRYGAPGGGRLLIMAVSHFRVINGRVREEVTVWDDLAVQRQAETWRSA